MKPSQYPAFGGGGCGQPKEKEKDSILLTEINVLDTPGNDFDDNYGVRGF